MIIFYILFTVFALLMGAGAINTVFRGGEKEGICQYNYTEEGTQQ